MKRYLKKILIALGLINLPADDGIKNPIHKWDEDVEFQNIMKMVAGHTIVDVVRCYILYQMGLQAAMREGDVAEIGVYKGGTAMLLSNTFKGTSKKIHLFDTFTGMPPADPQKDLHKEGDFNDTSFNGVKAYLSDYSNVMLHPGLFPNTAASIKESYFSMVHIDVDIYKSVMDCIKFFYPRLAKGGIMIFDDYGYISCPGAKLAVDEFFVNKKEKPCYLPTGQCLVIKL